MLILSKSVKYTTPQVGPDTDICQIPILRGVFLNQEKGFLMNITRFGLGTYIPSLLVFAGMIKAYTYGSRTPPLLKVAFALVIGLVVLILIVLILTFIV